MVSQSTKTHTELLETQSLQVVAASGAKKSITFTVAAVAQHWFSIALQDFVEFVSTPGHFAAVVCISEAFESMVAGDVSKITWVR
jgi:hypothetical protein